MRTTSSTPSTTWAAYSHSSSTRARPRLLTTAIARSLSPSLLRTDHGSLFEERTDVLSVRWRSGDGSEGSLGARGAIAREAGEECQKQKQKHSVPLHRSSSFPPMPVPVCTAQNAGGLLG
eukprot:scaffold3855_cov131-Pinguiococcus_pyrenoidosus.AAC.1